jgi:hypothetical protein
VFKKKELILEAKWHGFEVLTVPSFHVFFSMVLIFSNKELEFHCIFNGMHIKLQLLTRCS